MMEQKPSMILLDQLKQMNYRGFPLLRYLGVGINGEIIAHTDTALHFFIHLFRKKYKVVISYDEGLDLYNMEFFKKKHGKFEFEMVSVKEISGVFWDQLPELLAEFQE